MRLGVGIPLHSDLDYLEAFRDIAERDADFFEVNPEALWREVDGRLEPNDFRPIFQEIRRRSGKPFVAHGLGFSLGTPVDVDRPRSEAWLERLRADQADFAFPWISEHLGWQFGDGRLVHLPLPLPLCAEAIDVVASRLRLLTSVSGFAAFENGANHFCLGDPLDEPAFFAAICRSAPARLLLDLHNVHTQCLNLGTDPEEYLDRIDVDHVLEIHVSGGGATEASWAPSGRVYRLDSHDGPVPEEVWRLLERTIPRCRNLRAVVVERLNGTFEAADVPALAAEVRRAKELFPC